MTVAHPGIARPLSFDFLSGGGEMGALMRAYDWASSPMGPPAAWPSTLKTALRLMLTTNHPMFIWWGGELIQFYNDAYRQTLGAERHPRALGQRGRDCWEEVWNVIGPQIDLVMAGHGATWNEEHLIPLTRNGKRQDVWWTYSYSPIEDEAGVQGVLVICKDVTREHRYRKDLEDSNQALAMEVERRQEAQADLAAERDRIDAALARSESDLAQQVLDWQQLHAMVSRLLRAHSLQEQFEIVLRTVAAFHRCEQGAVALYDAKKGGLVVQTSLGLTDDGLVQLACVPAGAGACGTAFRDNRRVIVEDTAVDPLYKDYRQFAKGQGIRSLYSTPFFSHTGEPLGVLSIYFSTPRTPNERELRLTDICIGQIASFVEREKAEASLLQMTQESERLRRLYETVLSNTPDLVYVFDLDHRFTYANDVLLAMWGRTWDDAIGKTCLELGYEPWHAELHDREIELVKATRRPIRGEVPFSGTFGRRIYDYIFVPVLGPDGEVEAIAGTTRDVTDRKQMEDELRASNAHKDEFLAMLAHELRNPLAPIASAAELLQMAQPDSVRIRQASQVIHRQVRHMTGLVDDLLDMSRVTRGLVTVKKTPQDLKSIVSSAVEQVRPLVESKRHTLALELAAEPAHVLGDQKRLVQIVTNVLNNAARYTSDHGRIDVKMQVDDASLSLIVEDNGIGIEPELQARIFELFAQAERTSDRSQGGLGIGLALVKGLLELHQGRIRCASEGLGKGSRFTITLPRLLKPENDAGCGAGARSLRVPDKKLHVLVVDDNVDAANMLAMYLRAIGHSVTVEQSAARALQCIAAEPPDVCLLDIGLPEMNGHELARRIRSEHKSVRAMLIAVTGYGQEQDKQHALAAGFDYHLTKPVDLDRLQQIMSGL